MIEVSVSGQQIVRWTEAMPKLNWVKKLDILKNRRGNCNDFSLNFPLKDMKILLTG
jgi:hypothetical protein